MNEMELIPWSPSAPAKMTEQVNDAIGLLPQIAPKGFNIAEFNARAALQFVSDPSLYDCKPTSVIQALMKCASLGLIVGEECSLVRFGNDCTLMIEHQAYQRKFSELPGYKRCITDVVREQDEFDYDQLEGTIRHKPNLKARSAKMVFAYCVVEFQNGDRWFEVLDEEDIERHKRRAQGNGARGPWATDPKEMWRKSAINALAARYQASIPGMNRQLDAALDAARIEYQATPPSQESYLEAVNLLYGDSLPARHDEIEQDLRDLRTRVQAQHEGSPPAPRSEAVYYGVNPETGEVERVEDEPEPEPMPIEDISPAVSNEVEDTPSTELQGLDESGRIMRLHADVEALMRGKNFKVRQVAYLINECGGGETPFADLRDLAVLRQMYQRLAPDPGLESGQVNLIPEVK